MNWALEVPGVGGAKIFPLAYGNGTVKVVIMDANKSTADKTLLKAVLGHIEQVRPIGASVTVESAVKRQMDVSVTIIFDTENYLLEQVKENIIARLTKHLKSIAFIEDYISYARIGALLLDVPGVVDYTNLLINGTKENVEIGETEILILGGVVIEG